MFGIIMLGSVGVGVLVAVNFVRYSSGSPRRPPRRGGDQAGGGDFIYFQDSGGSHGPRGSHHSPGFMGHHHSHDGSDGMGSHDGGAGDGGGGDGGGGGGD